MKWSLAALCIGFLLDLCFGDPHWMPHPVRWIGRLIEKTEHLTRRIFPDTQAGTRMAGTVMALAVLTVSTAVPFFLLWGTYWIHPLLRLALESIMCYQILAVKSLRVESMKVFHALKNEGLPAARKAVSMIVGRDTAHLDAAQVAKAAVETVAENTSDGVVAPILFLALGGAPLGFFYKAVNTMDSMVGYKNDRYLDFGRFAAKLDDVLNFIPARVSALLMIGAAYLLRFDGGQAFRIFRRDRLNHASPNSAQTESVCAGALGIQLAGDAVYFGKTVSKPTIGEDTRAVCPRDIRSANRLMQGTAWLALILSAGIKALVVFSLGGFS